MTHERGDLFDRMDDLARREDATARELRLDRAAPATFQSLNSSFVGVIRKAAHLPHDKVRDAFGAAHVYYDVHAEQWIKRGLSRGFRRDHLDKRLAEIRVAIGAAWRKADSALERQLLPWLAFADWEPIADMPAIVDVADVSELPPNEICIVPQFPFMKFRMDFLMVIRRRGHSLWLCIECDGADYHHPAEDLKREKAMRSWGIHTFRATGSEITQRPDTVARDIRRIAVDWAHMVDVQDGVP